MDKPSEEQEPKDPGEDKLNDRHEQPALDQLTQARNKETAQSRNHIAGGTLTRHRKRFSLPWGATSCFFRRRTLRGGTKAGYRIRTDDLLIYKSVALPAELDWHLQKETVLSGDLSQVIVYAIHIRGHHFHGVTSISVLEKSQELRGRNEQFNRRAHATGICCARTFISASASVRELAGIRASASNLAYRSSLMITGDLQPNASVFDGNGVLTRDFLLRRGFCCENGCRNCPYGFVAGRCARIA